MNAVQLEIEKGKKILRDRGINFKTFRSMVSPLLVNAHVLEEDEWVEYYNSYAGCVGRTLWENVEEWAKEWFRDYNQEEHRIWLYVVK